MKIAYIECDHCKKREDIEPPNYAGGGTPFINWIKVSCPMANSWHKLKSGLYHFCSEPCLIGFMLEPKVTPEQIAHHLAT